MQIGATLLQQIIVGGARLTAQLQADPLRRIALFGGHLRVDNGARIDGSRLFDQHSRRRKLGTNNGNSLVHLGMIERRIELLQCHAEVVALVLGRRSDGTDGGSLRSPVRLVSSMNIVRSERRDLLSGWLALIEESAKAGAVSLQRLEQLGLVLEVRLDLAPNASCCGGTLVLAG